MIVPVYIDNHCVGGANTET